MTGYSFVMQPKDTLWKNCIKGILGTALGNSVGRQLFNLWMRFRGIGIGLGHPNV